jgi:hypothetical protein
MVAMVLRGLFVATATRDLSSYLKLAVEMIKRERAIVSRTEAAPS